MAKKKPPTDNIEALSNFIQGRALFDSYWENGNNPDDLSEARECFELSTRQDPRFEIAKVYWVAAEAELGNPAEAISVLSDLKESEFRLDARVQLARAYAKKGEYGQAVKQLEKAEKQPEKAENEAKRDGRKDKLDLVKAYRALFRALEGACQKDSGALKEAKDLAREAKDLADKASKLSQKDDDIGRETRFEAENASGVAHMWLGKLSPSDAVKDWENAEEKFRAALEIRPNSTRALYNMGMLFMFWGDHDEAKRQERYEGAKSFIARALEINPFDELVDHTMALLNSKTGNQKKAEEHAEKWDLKEWLQGLHSKDTQEALSELLFKKDRLHSTLRGYVSLG